MDDAYGSEQHLLHVRGVGDDVDDDFRPLGHLPGRLRALCAGVEEGLHLRTSPVPDGDGEPRLQQVHGHAAAHEAQAYKSYALHELHRRALEGAEASKPFRLSPGRRAV